ncbi:MAG: MFS transporter [Desulfobacterales bacterium]|nr:MFS transporter [Desulfobacterales bacterium]
MKIPLLLFFWICWFLNFSSRAIISPLLPVIEDELAISHALAGSLFFFTASGFTAATLFSGFLSYRIGYKKSIMLCFAVLTVGLFVMRYAATYAGIATVCLFIGAGGGIYVPNTIPLLTEIFSREHWGKVLAFHDSGASFSILAVPLLVALGLPFFHWRTLFPIMAGASVIILGAVIAFVPNTRHQKHEKIRFLDIMGRGEFWIMIFIWLAATASSMGIYGIIPLFLVKEKGMPLETANTIFGLSRIGGFFAAVLSGFVADRFGVKKVLYVLILITGVSTIAVAASRAFPFLISMLVIQATFGTAFFPIGFLAISKLTPPNERGAFTGAVVAIAVGLGSGMTPSILGAVADLWNFQVGILGLGILTTLSTLLLRRLKDI